MTKKHIKNANDHSDDFDFFDGNFEVAYDEDLFDIPDRRDLDNRNPHKDNHSNYEDHYKNNYEDDYEDDYDYENDYDYEDDDYEDVLSCLDELDPYDSERSEEPKRKRRKKKKRKKLPNLLSPVAKTAKTGGKIIYKVVNLLLRCATLILMALIFYKLALAFWQNHSALGSAFTMINGKNYTLAAYFGVALFLLLFELIAFLLVLTSSKKGSHKGRPADKGRGLFSFIFIGGCSYLAWMLNPLVPTSPEPLQGVKAALTVYGSLHTALIGLCIAGVISCLIRKFFIR